MTAVDEQGRRRRVLAHARTQVGDGETPLQADSFQVTVAWIGSEPLLPGRRYELRLDHQRADATLQRPKHALDDSFQPLPARTLMVGEMGVLSLTTDRPIGFRPACDDPHQALFELRDPVTHVDVAVGAINFALRRSQNVQWQALDIDRDARAELLGQRPALLWFTGLSGSGKSTIANLVEQRLHSLGRHTFLLDGDNVRHGLNRDLGFTDADRVENIRRVGEVARLMTDAGLIVLAAFISPFRAERRMVRDLMVAGEFIEVFVDTPLAVAEERDVKGLYAKARAGHLSNFTGIDSPYEAPEHPEIRIDTTATTAEAAADLIVTRLVGQPAER